VLPTLLLIAALFVGLWLYRLGRAKPVPPQMVLWSGLAALAIALFLRQPWLAAAIAAGLGLVFWRPGELGGQAARFAKAERLLGVGASASEEEIRTAWRNAMKTAHPDSGGDPLRARAATEARDLLLARARKDPE
jgi:hypothetical protein